MLEKYDTILIGGSGFVGTRLGKHLAGAGERVLNLSRRQSGESVSGVDFAKIDFENQEEVVGFILPQADALIILIGQIGPGFNPESDRRALQMIIEHANAQAEPLKVLYCSTALVYGNCNAPAKETDPLQPIEPYAKHKLENEMLLKDSIAKHHHLGILRLANVYGDTRSRGFVSLVMNRLLAPSSETFRVNGDGHQERDYIFVDDLVEAIANIKAGLNGWDIVNIATGESRSLLSVIEVIQFISGRKLPFTVTQEPVIEAVNIRVSNERLCEVYGYTPRHTFNEGLTLMWDQALSELSNPLP